MQLLMRKYGAIKMKYKVSFFLWLVGIMLMLAAMGMLLLGDKTVVTGFVWFLGIASLVASLFPVLKGKKK